MGRGAQLRALGQSSPERPLPLLTSLTLQGQELSRPGQSLSLLSDPVAYGVWAPGQGVKLREVKGPAPPCPQGTTHNTVKRDLAGSRAGAYDQTTRVCTCPAGSVYVGASCRQVGAG